MKSPCVRCGELLIVPDGMSPVRVSVAFTVDELELMAANAPTRELRTRMVCALGLVDRGREEKVRAELAENQML